MNVEHLSSRLAEHVAVLEALAQGLTAEQARWKPEPEAWSVLEVVNHLFDEEREDFRQRLDYTLHRPGEPWPAINPQGWVTERSYNSRDLAESLRGFLAERARSLTWLRGLSAPDWEATYTTPWGTMTAGDLLVAWVAHDLLHTRQLVELRWAIVNAELQPRRVEYAGTW